MGKHAYIWRSALWLFSLCMLCSESWALPTIDLSQHPSGGHTKDSYVYTREYSEHVPFEQVLRDKPWQHPKSGITNRGFSDKPSWMAFSLKNPTTQALELVLEYVDASAQSIDVYYRPFGSTQIFEHLHYGFDLPVSTRSVSFYRPAFSLNLPEKSQYEVYIRIFQGNEMTMHCFTSFRIWQQRDFYRSSNIEMVLLVALLCLELFMGLASVIVYFSTRDKLFLAYAFFVFSAAGLFAGLSGFWGYFISPQHYELWMVVFKINTCQIAALYFIRLFLNLKRHSLLLDGVIWLLIFVGFIGLITNLMGYPDISRSTADFIAIFYILLIPIGLYAHKKGVRNALLFTFSWVIFIIGMMLASMRLSGLMPDTFLTQWMIYIGGFSEVSLLATIMVMRIYSMEKEKIKIKKELDNALEDAQENNKVKDKFLGVFSHELRTPLNGILGSLQLLGFSNLSDEQKEHKDTASRSAKSLLRMVESILTFSELTSKKARTTLHDVNLYTNIHGMLNNFQHAAKIKNLILKSEISPNIPEHLKLDWPNIQRILAYWIDNAIKFSHQGEVAIKVECEKNQDEYKLSFYVSDQGPGMKPETLIQISQGFEKKDSNTIKNIDGLGLGLANSIKISELIGAQCQVTSSNEHGTQYRLDLTCQKAEPKEAEQAAKFHGQVHVLAVDDNKINLMILTEILKKNGMIVDQAKNGQEALEKANTHSYHTIFMDCQMPVMDGYQATRCIRESDNLNCSTPIIAVTANAYDSDREHCLYVGMNDFVSKPISESAIMDAFNRWCNTLT